MAVSLCMVAFGDRAELSEAGFPKAWAARWPKSPQPTADQKEEGVIAYRVGDCSLIFGMMRAPIPWADLEPLCKNAPYWPDAAELMRKHTKHVIVTAMSDGSPIERMMMLTQAVIALVDSTPDAVGVLWVSSLQLMLPATFAEVARPFIPEGLPLPLWVNFAVMRNADGSSAGFTRGLAALGLREFETTKSPEPPAGLRDRLLELADYALRNGSVIKDGDTIGEDDREKIKVTYDKSAFGLEGEVMRLEYADAAPAGQKMTLYGRIHALAVLACTIGFGYVAYAYFPLLTDSVFRHFLLIPATLVFGVFLLVLSDKMLQTTFGLQAFDTPKK